MKIKFITKRILFFLGSIVAVFLISRLSLNYSGYCHNEGRYLSDQEKIDLAVLHIVSSYPPVIDVYDKSSESDVFVGRISPENPIKYSCVEEFYDENKNCCEISETGKNGVETPLTYKLLGSLDKYVRVEYKVKYKDLSGNMIEVVDTSFVAISNCGHAWSGI